MATLSSKVVDVLAQTMVSQDSMHNAAKGAALPVVPDLRVQKALATFLRLQPASTGLQVHLLSYVNRPQRTSDSHDALARDTKGAHLGTRHQIEGSSFAPKPPAAANSVQVCLIGRSREIFLHRHIIVDDQGDLQQQRERNSKMPKPALSCTFMFMHSAGAREHGAEGSTGYSSLRTICTDMQEGGRQHLRDVKASGEDICRDEDLGDACAELIHNAVAQLVVQVAPDARAPVPCLRQLQNYHTFKTPTNASGTR